VDLSGGHDLTVTGVVGGPGCAPASVRGRRLSQLAHPVVGLRKHGIPDDACEIRYGRPNDDGNHADAWKWVEVIP